jgi:hypothetical protein
MATSIFAMIISPAPTLLLPDAFASIFSAIVMAIQIPPN